MAQHGTSLLKAALVGYQPEHDRITTATADIQKRLGRGSRRGALRPQAARDNSAPAGKKHRISAEGRARIAAAQLSVGPRKRPNNNLPSLHAFLTALNLSCQ